MGMDCRERWGTRACNMCRVFSPSSFRARAVARQRRLVCGCVGVWVAALAERGHCVCAHGQEWGHTWGGSGGGGTGSFAPVWRLSEVCHHSNTLKTKYIIINDTRLN